LVWSCSPASWEGLKGLAHVPPCLPLRLVNTRSSRVGRITRQRVGLPLQIFQLNSLLLLLLAIAPWPPGLCVQNLQPGVESSDPLVHGRGTVCIITLYHELAIRLLEKPPRKLLGHPARGWVARVCGAVAGGSPGVVQARSTVLPGGGARAGPPAHSSREGVRVRGARVAEEGHPLRSSVGPRRAAEHSSRGGDAAMQAIRARARTGVATALRRL